MASQRHQTPEYLTAGKALPPLQEIQKSVRIRLSFDAYIGEGRFMRQTQLWV